MNPILIVLILIAGFLLWLICSFLYKPIGKFFGRLWEDAGEAINYEETNNKTNNENNKE